MKFHSVGVLPTWDKPAFACLSSRFPYGTRITRENLRLVDRAEQFLFDLGIRQFRVRHHDTLARIEVDPQEIEFVAAKSIRAQINERFKSLGYEHVALDLQGYRSGSLNEGLLNLSKLSCPLVRCGRLQSLIVNRPKICNPYKNILPLYFVQEFIGSLVH